NERPERYRGVVRRVEICLEKAGLEAREQVWVEVQAGPQWHAQPDSPIARGERHEQSRIEPKCTAAIKKRDSGVQLPDPLALRILVRSLKQQEHADIPVLEAKTAGDEDRDTREREVGRDAKRNEQRARLPVFGQAEGDAATQPPFVTRRPRRERAVMKIGAATIDCALLPKACPEQHRLAWAHQDVEAVHR